MFFISSFSIPRAYQPPMFQPCVIGELPRTRCRAFGIDVGTFPGVEEWREGNYRPRAELERSAAVHPCGGIGSDKQWNETEYATKFSPLYCNKNPGTRERPSSPLLGNENRMSAARRALYILVWCRVHSAGIHGYHHPRPLLFRVASSDANRYHLNAEVPSSGAIEAKGLPGQWRLTDDEALRRQHRFVRDHEEDNRAHKVG